MWDYLKYNLTKQSKVKVILYWVTIYYLNELLENNFKNYHAMWQTRTILGECLSSLTCWSILKKKEGYIYGRKSQLVNSW